MSPSSALSFFSFAIPIGTGTDLRALDTLTDGTRFPRRFSFFFVVVVFFVVLDRRSLFALRRISELHARPLSATIAQRWVQSNRASARGNTRSP